MLRHFGEFDLIESLPAPEPGFAAYVARRHGGDGLLELRVAGRGVEPGSEAAAALLKRIEGLRRIAHPNLVRLVAIGLQHGLPFYAVELLEGPTLREYLDRRGGRLAATECHDLLGPIATVLQGFHRHGLAHGLVGLDSIRVDEASGRALLSTWALGSLLDLAPAPIAPSLDRLPVDRRREARDRGDERADVFLWAAVLVQALTGVRLPGRSEAARGGAGGPIPELGGLAELAHGASPALAAWVLAGLSTDPALRPALADFPDPARAVRRPSRVLVRPDRGHPQAGEDTPLAAIAGSFQRSGPLAKAALFLLVAGASASVPLSPPLPQGRAGPPPGSAAAPRPARPGAGAKVAPAPGALSPAPPRLSPAEAALLDAHRQTLEDSTRPRNFDARLKVLWEFASGWRPEDRADAIEVASLIEVRKVYARDPDAGCRELERRIGDAAASLKRRGPR